jgi:prepilin-type N-terminal cleavage/methylation domain-containing protein
MHKYRYETREMTSMKASTPRSAFTLTELLVVITIIAILTSLITVAAVNALRTAKQARITMEMQQISNAL